ncbi:hypothetical protein K437DRAFT_246632 [Tilletiaria anomala UBC 951]|uniref:ER membrane protein complex subunit 7 beta-sandwich domain-containing protein n=1 Tax=Tilletiaria anomala (strain ATCC 24038 / CBS 436.72 / UBC 951) TaxID=1037660 RepID=A0A066W188_TILAU|nr:uncharacterized protein K437DRAFT_246632 [Tilletiaria anomala UBC 951]KDN46303.1 hypothetical protein K437DRAFT_246632 [Tilletiaria anomala UBC 951]
MRSPRLLPAVVSLMLLLLLTCIQARAAVVRGQIQPNEHLRELSSLGPHTKISLRRIPDAPTFVSDSSVSAEGESNGRNTTAAQGREVYQTFIRRDGSFVFPDVIPGAYVLKISSRWHAFRTYRVDVSALLGGEGHGQTAVPDFRNSARNSVKIRSHTPGTPLSSTLTHAVLPSPFIVQPLAAFEFFTEPEGFNIKALLGNPMMLIVIAGGVLVFLMPKLMANMDPESLAELNEQQAAMQAKMNALQSGDIGSLFKDEPRTAGSAGAAPTRSAPGGGGGKRRR